jgi:hypothetical protein
MDKIVEEAIDALILAMPTHAVVLECEVKGDLSSWTERYDTEKDGGWKFDELSYWKTERIDLTKRKSGPKYKEVETRISRHSGRLVTLTTASDASSVHKVEGECKVLRPEDRKF